MTARTDLPNGIRVLPQALNTPCQRRAELNGSMPTMIVAARSHCHLTSLSTTIALSRSILIMSMVNSETDTTKLTAPVINCLLVKRFFIYTLS